MKKLILLNENTDVKLNDTGTIIQFKAQNDGQPVSISNDQTATFRIKNDFGFVKSVNASSSYGGYVFELNTADLSGLVVGPYQVELLIQKDADDALIFPDTAFVGFNITANALNITGEQLPMMSLDDFKNELKTYVDNQSNSLKDNFESYVADVKVGPQGEQGIQGPIGPQGPQGDAGTIMIGTVSSTSETASVTNVGTDSNAILNFNLPKGEQGPQGIQGEQGPQGPIGEQGPSGTIGDYVVGTGWQDLTPYLNKDMWSTWDSNDANNYGSNFYSVTSINGQNIFWFKIHAKIKDASNLGVWGYKLFDIPTEVQQNYCTTNSFMPGQFNTLLEVNGYPCLTQVTGDDFKKYVQTRGYLQLNWNGHTTSQSAPSGTNVAVHYTGWFIL